MIDPELLAPLIGRWEKRASLSAEDRAAIFSLPFSTRAFDRDAYILREGDEVPVCGLLLAGFAYRQKLVKDGARQILSIHIPGEFVDLQTCLLTMADHNVQSLGRSEVAMVPKTALLELAERRSTVGRAMWLDTLIDSSVFREWVVNVGRRDARSRIAHLLCEVARRLDAAGLGEAGSYRFPLTQEQLADCTGLTPVHTNRVLQGLRRDGLISLEQQSLTVHDWQGLQQVGEFSDRYLFHAA